jgi:lipid-binding SYLF domain-containing protein
MKISIHLKPEIMKTIKKLTVAAVILLSSGTLLAASFSEGFSRVEKNEKKANKTLVRSVEALDHIMADPENYIPPSLIIQSEGIVIFPGAFKLAVGVAGGQGARGIAMIRRSNGAWSNPFFVTLGEGSLGVQLGAQKSDIVLLFKEKSDLIELEETELTLGGDVGVAAGPVSRGASTMTDIKFESEIYSYSLSNGLFAGVSFKGGVLTYNQRFNESLYGKVNVSSDEIFYETETPFNEEVIELIDTVNYYAE